jgi:hypothetical protein
MGSVSGVTAPTSRSTIIGAALGAVFLGLLVAFSVALPESAESSASAPDHAAITLPESLPGEWTAVDVLVPDTGTPEDQEKFAEQQQEAVAYVNDVLGEVYPDYPTAFRAYANDDLSAFVTLTAFAAPGGAFAPNGFTSAERAGLAKAPMELVRVDGAVCQVNWRAVADTEEFPAEERPLGTSCQLEEDGRTFQLSTQGMSVDDTVTLLHQAVAATG